MANDRISEQELVLPSLYFMYMKENGKITTSELIDLLTSLFHPEGLDAQILDGRNDTRFSQKVRNLKSHSTFQRYGYADNTVDGFQITPLGKQFVNAKIEMIKYLFASRDMDFVDISRVCDDILNSETNREIFPLTETIVEGRINTAREVVIYERSSQLRQLARQHFLSADGLLYCDCCHYEYTHFHSEPFNQSCIEIHHIKPLYLYEDSDIEKTFQQALNNLMPVCPNCHRLIHRNKVTADQLSLFKSHCYQFTY